MIRLKVMCVFDEVFNDMFLSRDPAVYSIWFLTVFMFVETWLYQTPLSLFHSWLTEPYKIAFTSCASDGRLYSGLIG